MNWSLGDVVRHATQQQWGRGKVLEIAGAGKLRVYFERAGEKLLLDGMLIALEGADAAAPIAVPRQPSRAGKAGRPAKTPGRSLNEYRQVFLQQYPGGFLDEAYLLKERQYKVGASGNLAAALGRPSFAALMKNQDYDEVFKQAKVALNRTNLVNRFELIRFSSGMAGPDKREQFAKALAKLLEDDGDFERRFVEFCDVRESVGAPKWTIATYYPYLMWPKRHMFLKPTPTRRIADACGIELNYRVQPNWLTYRSLLEVAERLSDLLADLKPKDMIDLQSFIWLSAR